MIPVWSDPVVLHGGGVCKFSFFPCLSINFILYGGLCFHLRRKFKGKTGEIGPIVSARLKRDSVIRESTIRCVEKGAFTLPTSMSLASDLFY